MTVNRFWHKPNRRNRRFRREGGPEFARVIEDYPSDALAAPEPEEPEILRTVQGFVTKDSGKRAEFANGGVRDSQDGKPRFDLLTPETVPYEHQILTRWAHLMARGAEKYEDRNWERFNDQAALDRAKSSAFRHFMQWLNGETDEDHAVSVMSNIMFAEYVAGVLAGRWPAKEAEK